MQATSVQKTGAMISAVGSRVKETLRPAMLSERDAQKARHKALTMASLVWGLGFLVGGLALLAVAPIPGTVATAFGLLGWGGVLNLLAIGP